MIIIHVKYYIQNLQLKLNLNFHYFHVLRTHDFQFKFIAIKYFLQAIFTSGKPPTSLIQDKIHIDKLYSIKKNNKKKNISHFCPFNGMWFYLCLLFAVEIFFSHAFRSTKLMKNRCKWQTLKCRVLNKGLKLN